MQINDIVLPLSVKLSLKQFLLLLSKLSFLQCST